MLSNQAVRGLPRLQIEVDTEIPASRPDRGVWGIVVNFRQDRYRDRGQRFGLETILFSGLARLIMCEC